MFGLGQVYQTGFVVADMNATLDRWTACGVGPFFLRTLALGGSMDGSPVNFTARIALGFSDHMQIELIQVVGGDGSPYPAPPRGEAQYLHHLAFQVQDVRGETDRLVRRGMRVHYELNVGGADYAYLAFEAGGGSGLVELLPVRAESTRRDSVYKDAAANWQGEDPVRTPQGEQA